MIGNISSYASQFNYSSYAASRTRDTGYAVSAQKAAQPQTPVQPVRAVDKTAPETQAPKSFGLSIREGADPVEMAVRMRIKYAEGSEELKLSDDLNGESVERWQGQEQAEMLKEPGLPGQQKDEAAMTPWEREQAEKLKELNLPGQQKNEAAMTPWEQERAQKLKEFALPGQEDKAEEPEDLKLPGASEEENAEETQGKAEESEEDQECQTCEKRKYQDGSADPGVSFKTPGHIDPKQSAATVRGHEMEHVVNNRAKAARENREIISQSVTLNTAICPECGTVYTSGGTTRTVFSGPKQQGENEQQTEQNGRLPFSAVA